MTEVERSFGIEGGEIFLGDKMREAACKCVHVLLCVVMTQRPHIRINLRPDRCPSKAWAEEEGLREAADEQLHKNSPPQFKAFTRKRGYFGESSCALKDAT